MKKQEAAFSRKVLPWLVKNIGTCAWEAKHTRGKVRFSLREVKIHQYNFLAAARSKRGLGYKIPDDAVAFKPFDGFVLKNVPAYIVIAFPKEFAVIPYDALWAWPWPSITLEEAKKIALRTAPLSVLN